jgi:hypothetical protein
VSDLAPLTGMVNLQILRLFQGEFSLAALPTLQRRVDRYGLAAEQGRSVFAKGDDGAPPPVSAAALGDIVAKIVAGAAATRAQ